MTTIETMRAVRMLLDDSRDWFPTTAEIAAIINEAQLRKVHEYYIKMDERALRPLYRTSLGFTDGSIITAGTNPLLYPRAVRMKASGADDEYSVSARYVPPELFYNYVPPGTNPGDRFPRVAYYTVTKVYSTVTSELESYIWLSDTDTVANLVWVIEPDVFVYDATIPANNVALSLPSEYHHEVVFMAAELANNIDVGEMERGLAAYQNQKLTLDKLDE